MTPNQPRFELHQILFYISGIVALIALVFWWDSRSDNITIDWELILPLISVICAGIPFGNSVVSWLNKRLKENDKRIDELEVEFKSLQQQSNASNRDRIEIRKIVLKVEARLESLRDNQVGAQLGELMELNRQLLKKVEKNG